MAILFHSQSFCQKIEKENHWRYKISEPVNEPLSSNKATKQILGYIHMLVITINQSINHQYNWSLQPFSQDYDLVSDTIYVVSVSFLYEWRDLKSIPNNRFLRNFSMAILFSLTVFFFFLPDFYLEEDAKEIIFFIFCFWCLNWDTNPGFTTNKPTH